MATLVINLPILVFANQLDQRTLLSSYSSRELSPGCQTCPYQNCIKYQCQQMPALLLRRAASMALSSSYTKTKTAIHK